MYTVSRKSCIIYASLELLFLFLLFTTNMTFKRFVLRMVILKRWFCFIYASLEVRWLISYFYNSLQGGERQRNIGFESNENSYYIIFLFFILSTIVTIILLTKCLADKKKDQVFQIFSFYKKLSPLS